MLDDLTLITREYPASQTVLRVYAIGDVHVGSPEFDERAIKEKIKRIKEDPFGVVSLCGDLADYGLKNSLTNVYKATMTPREQQRYVFELFKPITDKIISCVPGNHEERIVKEVGTCPLYDLCVMWGISDVYRENVALVKLAFGGRKGKNKSVFIGLTSHGSSRNKHQKFIAGFDGIDWAISGHVHKSYYAQHSKIRIDRVHGTATNVPYKELVIDANLKPGGYGLKKEYEIQPPPTLQYLELSSYRENDYNRTDRRKIDYHSITL